MAKNTILVKSKSAAGFRRAGIAFDRTGVELDPSKLKKGQLDAIVNEPNLIVIDVESDADRAKRLDAEKKAADKAAAEADAAAAAADKAAADAAAAAAKDSK